MKLNETYLIHCDSLNK